MVLRGVSLSRLSESNRRPIHYEFVLDPVLGRAHAAGACHGVLDGMAVEGGRGHVGGTVGADADTAGLRIDPHLAAREGAAQKALDALSRAGSSRKVAVEVGSGPPWACARAATAGASLVQALESRPQLVESTSDRPRAAHVSWKRGVRWGARRRASAEARGPHRGVPRCFAPEARLSQYRNYSPTRILIAVRRRLMGYTLAPLDG